MNVLRAGLLTASLASTAASAATGNQCTSNYCNVTVTYGHPGFNDTINTNVFLPVTGWNGRFQGVGGGGWATSSGAASLLAPVAEGYSAGNTDGGHSDYDLTSAVWAFLPDGSNNLPLLEDFSYLALGELATIGKQLSTRYYGAAPRYAYWNGCSTGGRQGLMMAQRYPTAYDGIYAGSPAIHWESFQVAQYWGQYLMASLGHYPPPCAYDTITAAAVAACDELDGVADGVIAALSLCRFDPHTLVGTAANCTAGNYTITEEDAVLAEKVWQGPRDGKGNFLWWGINPGTEFEGLTDTVCADGVTNCTGVPFSIAPDWIANWVLDDPDFDFATLTVDSFAALFPEARAKYSALIGTEDPDLSAFRAAGGKMVSWHGLADQLIYPAGTESYYQAAERADPAVRDFYRFFPAPGVMHCGGGAGDTPSDPFGAVVAWVENGTAPETLPAASTDGTSLRDLCQYPLVSVFKGGDPKDASSFACGTSWSDLFDEDQYHDEGTS
ncbi:putative feruloyl esterase [Xylariaceae sp. FL0804]|nr:putative feruloyl esterase [Xylariaceae sp. FL0804]